MIIVRIILIVRRRQQTLIKTIASYIPLSTLLPSCRLAGQIRYVKNKHDAIISSPAYKIPKTSFSAKQKNVPRKENTTLEQHILDQLKRNGITQTNVSTKMKFIGKWRQKSMGKYAAYHDIYDPKEHNQKIIKLAKNGTGRMRDIDFDELCPC